MDKSVIADYITQFQPRSVHISCNTNSAVPLIGLLNDLQGAMVPKVVLHRIPKPVETLQI